MLGGMQSISLTLDTFLRHAVQWHGDREVVGRLSDGSIERSNYSALHDRARCFSNALLGLGVEPGDRVATLAWNGIRHMESWYAISGIGAICHTLNVRLLPDQIAWIVNAAQDKILIADADLSPIIAHLASRCPSLEHIVLFSDTCTDEFETSVPLHAFDALAAENDIDVTWGGFDENTAAGLCYTSGTSGDPKGVLYSHRSNYLHTLMTLQRDMFGLSVRDVVLPIVPMFHANAWGLTFSCPAVGAKVVLPGAKLDGASVHSLIEDEGVTFAAAVPTVWQLLIDYLDDTGGKLERLERVVIGGSALPDAVARRLIEEYDVEVVHGWGMTEMSPLGSMSTPIPEVLALPREQRLPYQLSLGRPPCGVEMKIVDPEGHILESDNFSGELMVRGPTIADRYYGLEKEILDAEGFFPTGDICSIDKLGYLHIVDRAKDVVKSGGEWISSIELENAVLLCAGVASAAVIATPDEKWGERPMLLVVRKENSLIDARAIQQHLDGRVAKWWIPEQIEFVSDIPLGPTGKIDKKLLRTMAKAGSLPIDRGQKDRLVKSGAAS